MPHSKQGRGAARGEGGAGPRTTLRGPTRRPVWLPREAHHVLMTDSPATRQLLRGLFQTWNTRRSSEATEVGLGLWPASYSSFSLSLAPSYHCLFFPGASAPAHQTEGFSGAPVSPHPLGVPGPQALGDWPALVNISSLFGVCLEAATQSLTLPKANG